MPYFSAAFARTDAGWIGTEVDLGEAAALDDIVDIMRETAVETSGDTVVLLVEQEDEWFAVVRLDDGEDPRVYLSDSQAGLFSEVAAILHEQLGGAGDSDEAAGDADLLADFGIDAERLAALGDRSLPGDALAAVAESAGFADEYDRLR